ncbi:MAG: FAD-binding oxidoreductase [Tropicimonas sp.]|uniref:FAD-binding oxidoreductase n=1 Tax=Tropicimonas sp. TaxID=2067044 RepID=UPI003A8631B6
MSLPERFRALLGERGVLDDPADLAPCLHDPITGRSGEAIALLRPQTTGEVAAVVRLCREAGLPITPRGGGTGFAAGAIPAVPGGVLISLERMRQVREVDPVSATVTVDAGVTLTALNEAVAEHGLSLPIRHGGEGSAQVGGTLSTNAGGYNVLRHGMARAHVLGLEVVLPDGRIWNGLRKLRKDNTGYDIKQLFIGAEGTLGLITGACLHLSPLATRHATALVAVGTPAEALEIHTRLHRALGELLSGSELFPGHALEMGLARVPGQQAPFAPLPAWMHLVALETSIAAIDLEGVLGGVLMAALEDGLGQDALIAASEAQREAFWMYRESLAVAQAESPLVLKSDTAVPVSESARLIENAGRAVAGVLPGAVPLPFGHLGDGNIHFNVMAPEGMDAEAFAAVKPDLTRAIEAESVVLGGTISAEHGIGASKREALWRARDGIERDMMVAIRDAFDRERAFNDGKIL